MGHKTRTRKRTEAGLRKSIVMEKNIVIVNQLIGIAGILIAMLTVNSPVWGTLGVQNLNPADSKYTAKGFFRRNSISNQRTK